MVIRRERRSMVTSAAPATIRYSCSTSGDLERCSLRPGNVHSADGWRTVLKPVVERYRERSLPSLIRLHDNAFALSGYSGRGVALSQALGPELASFFAENLPLDQVPLAVEAAKARPLNPVRAAAAPFVGGALKLVDLLGLS